MHYQEQFNWSVIPTVQKKPGCPWKPYMHQKPERHELGRLFVGDKVSGLAVICGSVSDCLRVRDFDQAEAYDGWASRNWSLAQSLPTVITARGCHVYFRASMPNTIAKRTDGELRAGNGYVLAPPSRHPSGCTYQWLNEPQKSIPWLDDPDAADLGFKGQEKSILSEDWSQRGRVGREGYQEEDSGDSIMYPSGYMEGGRVREYTKEERLPRRVIDTIRRYVPDGPGQRNRCILHLVIALRGLHLGSEDMRIRAFNYWFKCALPVIRTKDMKVSIVDYLRVWKTITTTIDWQAIKEASREHGWLPDTYCGWSSPARRLVCALAALRDALGEVFFLSQATAQRELEISHSTARLVLGRLVEMEVIEMLEKGSYATGKASLFRSLSLPWDSGLLGRASQ